MNKEYILSKIRPHLNSKGMLSEEIFNKLFSSLNKQLQYEIINILIESDIEIDYGRFDKESHNPVKNSPKVALLPDKFNKLTNEQLCVLYQNGNELALSALINNNKKLVWSRVLKYGRKFNHRLDEEDLVQYGLIGLIKAAKKFDLRKEAKFSTYAIWWIDQQIWRSIMNYGFTVRLPAHYFELVNKVLRILSKDPNAPKEQKFEMVKDIVSDREQFEEILMTIENIMSLTSLNTLVGEEEDTELGEYIADDITPTVEEEVEYNLLKETINKVLSTLTDREKEIMVLRFGLDDRVPRTLEQIGFKYKVTRERIRQIEAKALRKLRHPARSKKLRDFIQE